MSTQGFFTFLNDVSRRNNSLLCIGLDPPLDMPASDILRTNQKIIDAAAPHACACKPNAGFYEARGVEGWEILHQTIRYARARGLPVILDAKRGDISSTADAYAKACFDMLEADAVTASPFLGKDSVESFTCRPDKGVFLLCHTSNPGARDLQELSVEGATGSVPLYRKIAAMACSWNTRGNIGLVVGATYAHLLAEVREAAPDLWILLPGVGAQGGDLEASLREGLDAEGSRVLVNVSRAIWQAADPGDAASELCSRINSCRAPGPRSSRGASLVDQIALGLHDLGAVKFGKFTLKSGQTSPLYIDLRLLVSDPRLMAMAAAAMSRILSGLRFDRIAAIPYGGLPIGQAVALAADRPLLYPRKEVKEHGTRKPIEGTFAAGETVVVLDDLITTGASKLEAIQPLVSAGLTVTDIAVLVDREQGGKKELADKGLKLHSVMTVSDLLDSLVRHGRISDLVRSDVRSALGIG